MLGLTFQNDVVRTLRHEVKMASLRGQPFSTYLDVGANDGEVLIKMITLIPKAVAIEPSTIAYKRLTDRLRQTGYISKVSIFNLAVSSCNGERLLHTSGSDDQSSLVSFQELSHAYIVKVRTLDSLVSEMNLKPPFLIKMDIQGSEGEALSGATQLLSSNDCVIVSEFWPYGLRKSGWDPRDYLLLVRKLGFRIDGIERRHLSVRMLLNFTNVGQTNTKIATDLVFSPYRDW